MTDPDTSPEAYLGLSTDYESSEAEQTNLNRLTASDYGLLPQATRSALVQLLKGPYISEAQNPNVWATILQAEDEIKQRLGDLFLELIIDTEINVAFIRNMYSEDQELPKVVRSHSLTLLDTALVLFLREQLLNAEATGRRVYIDRSDIQDSLSVYRNLLLIDETAFIDRVNTSITRMKNQSVLLPTVEVNRYEISPILRLIFDADQVLTVTKEISRLIDESRGKSHDGDADSDLDGDADGDADSDLDDYAEINFGEINIDEDDEVNS
ncbi:MAG: DUF4194 domain-containing protein [Coriobacteriales bacterium]|jgi:hypothetical protein|nr:DUF4194 domain-containing protein [Coriobacteriales bacterium]